MNTKLFSVKLFLLWIAIVHSTSMHALQKLQYSAQDYIETLSLERHAAGSYFIQTYRSTDNVHILAPRYEGNSRAAGSEIYLLLDKEGFVSWHRVKSDEILHYYDGGSPIDIYIIDNDKLKKRVLGNPAWDENAAFQVVIKEGQWFAAEVRNKSTFALLGCTICPGFEFRDLELGKRENLIKLYPDHADIIKRLTRS